MFVRILGKIDIGTNAFLDAGGKFERLTVPSGSFLPDTLISYFAMVGCDLVWLFDLFLREYLFDTFVPTFGIWDIKSFENDENASLHHFILMGW